MARCAAIVTEIGSPGTWPSLLPEFGPTIVGLRVRGRHRSPPTGHRGRHGRRVLAGACPLGSCRQARGALEGSAAVTRLAEVAALIVSFD